MCSILIKGLYYSEQLQYLNVLTSKFESLGATILGHTRSNCSLSLILSFSSPVKKDMILVSCHSSLSTACLMRSYPVRIRVLPRPLSQLKILELEIQCSSSIVNQPGNPSLFRTNEVPQKYNIVPHGSFPYKDFAPATALIIKGVVVSKIDLYIASLSS